MAKRNNHKWTYNDKSRNTEMDPNVDPRKDSTLSYIRTFCSTSSEQYLIYLKDENK
jgi:hypothetical protein